MGGGRMSNPFVSLQELNKKVHDTEGVGGGGVLRIFKKRVVLIKRGDDSQKRGGWEPFPNYVTWRGYKHNRLQIN